MVAVTFPDGASRQFDPGVTGFDIAKSISPSLAKRSVAMTVDGALVDLLTPLDRDAKIEFVSREDPRALELIRHDAAHVLAEAVQELYPGTQVTIGPTTDEGFYYDFYREKPFTPEDLEAIEKAANEEVKKDHKFVRKEVSKEEALALFGRMGEKFKLEIIEDIFAKGAKTLSLYEHGDWVDFCLGPHGPSTGRVGVIKLLTVAGAYWRGDPRNAQLQRIYGTAFFNQKELDAHLKQIEEAKKRDHRKLGRELDLFSLNDEIGGGLVLWHPKGGMLRKIIEDYEKAKAAGIKVWQVGDTAYRPDQWQNIFAQSVDIVLPPINGAFGNMNGIEAAKLAAAAHAKVVIPCHFWMFAQHHGDPLEFLDACKEFAPEVRPMLMTQGERFIYQRQA